MFCSKCGKEINDEAVICPHCGCKTENFKTEDSLKKTATSSHEGMYNTKIAALLCFFLGYLGADCFYRNQNISGILWLLSTLLLGPLTFGIWCAVEAVVFLVKSIMYLYDDPEWQIKEGYSIE